MTGGSLEIKELIEEHPNMKTATVKKAVIIHSLDDEEQIGALEKALLRELGTDIEIKREKAGWWYTDQSDRIYTNPLWYPISQASWFTADDGRRFE